MRIVIGYESMYGNTHRIAEAIALGFGRDDDVAVVPIAKIKGLIDAADVLIVGTPTHLHGLPRPTSRRAALDSAETPYEHHEVDPAASVADGVREWLETLGPSLRMAVATFDTRFRPPPLLVGHPARRIARALARKGAHLLVAPESFFVDKAENLRPGELERAAEWGAKLHEIAIRPQAFAKQS